MIALPKQYFLETEQRNCKFRATVNGIEISSESNQSAQTFGAKLNVWLRQGDNPIFVDFYSESPDSAEPTSTVIISSVDKTGLDTNIFDSGDTAGGSSKFTLQIDVATNSVLEYAPVSSTGELAEIEIINEVESLYRALNKKDTDQVIKIQRIQVEEQAISLGLSPADAFDQYRKFLSEMWSSASWRIWKFDCNDLRISQTSFRNIVKVDTVSGMPVIAVSDGQIRFSIKPYFANVAGRWRIVR